MPKKSSLPVVVAPRTYRALSIDVGKVNLGVYIEEFTNADDGRCLYLRRVDLTEAKKERVGTPLLMRLFAYLDTIKDLLTECDFFVVEKQLKQNPEAQFVDHAIQSYLTIYYGAFKQIVSFASKNKTKVFDDTKMTKYQRKKWAVEKAYHVFTTRNDFSSLAYLESLAKKDDVSDAMCQLDAFKAILFKKTKK